MGVIDPASRSTTTIATGQKGRWKWSDIASVGSCLFCTPHDADAVLVIEPDTGATRLIATRHYFSNVHHGKWLGMAQLGSRLYCAPHNADDVLVIDPAQETIARIEAHTYG